MQISPNVALFSGLRPAHLSEQRVIWPRRGENKKAHRRDQVVCAPFVPAVSARLGAEACVILP
jgi:hypothetical protein